MTIEVSKFRAAFKKVKSDLIPTKDATYDLGTPALRWNNAYIVTALLSILLIGGVAWWSPDIGTLMTNATDIIINGSGGLSYIYGANATGSQLNLVASWADGNPILRLDSGSDDAILFVDAGGKFKMTEVSTGLMQMWRESTSDFTIAAYGGALTTLKLKATRSGVAPDISFKDNNNINITLPDNKAVKIYNLSGSEMISLDETGNITAAGNITATESIFIGGINSSSECTNWVCFKDNDELGCCNASFAVMFPGDCDCI